MFILLNIRPKKSIPIEAIEYDAQTSHWIDAHQRNKIQTLTLPFHIFKGHMNESILLFYYLLLQNASAHITNISKWNRKKGNSNHNIWLVELHAILWRCSIWIRFFPYSDANLFIICTTNEPRWTVGAHLNWHRAFLFFFQACTI